MYGRENELAYYFTKGKCFYMGMLNGIITERIIDIYRKTYYSYYEYKYENYGSYI